jgi:hypothetical protein
MHDFAAMNTLDLWYARLDVEDLAKQWAAAASPRELKRFEGNLAKARASLRAANRLTRVVEGRRRIASDPPLIVPIDELLAPDARAQLEDTGARRPAGLPADAPERSPAPARMLPL